MLLLTQDIQAGLPGVYAEVARQRDWIDNKVAWFGGATYCAN